MTGEAYTDDSKNEKGIDVTEIDVVESLRQIKILTEGENLSPEECAAITESAMTLCAEDTKLELDTAIALAYIDSFGAESLMRMNIDRLSIWLEEFTARPWSKEKTEELLQFLKVHAKTISFAVALQRFDTVRQDAPAVATQIVMDESTGQVLGVGDNRAQLLREASKKSGRDIQ